MLSALTHSALILQLAYGLLLLMAFVWILFPRYRTLPFWGCAGLGSICLIVGYHIASPWLYQHDFNASLTGIAARNHLHRGLTYTWGAELWNGGTATPLAPHFHLHHPPLITWLATITCSIFGIHELVIRLSIIIPFVLAFALYARTFPTWLLFASMPALAYYARMPRHEPLTILLMFLGLALYFKPPTKHSNLAWTLLAFLLVLSSWGGCFLAGIITITFLITRQKIFLPVFCGAAAAGLLILFILGAHLHWNFMPLIEQFTRRSSGTVSEGGTIDSFFTWFLAIGQHYNQLIGLLPTLLALIGAFTLRDKKKKGVILILFFFSIGLLLILRQWAFVHEYSVCYVAIPVLILAVNGIDFLLSRQSYLTKAIGLILVMGSLLHGLEHVNLRHRKLIGYQFAYKLGQQFKEMSQPNDVFFTVQKPPSPIFLYYADRDYAVWPDKIFDEGKRPRFFIQFRGEIPADPALANVLKDYKPTENPRIFELSNDQVQ